MTQSPVSDYQTDASLVRAVGRREAAAVEALYRTHADAIFRFVYRRLGNRYEDAEEVTQDTFLSALKLARGFRGDSSAFTWLCGIAKLRITDYYRRQARAKRVPPGLLSSLDGDEPIASLPDPSPSLDELVDQTSAAQVLDRMMSLLTDDEREVLLLRYEQQLPVREIGLLMRRTEKAVESLLTRAKRRLREQFTELA